MARKQNTEKEFAVSAGAAAAPAHRKPALTPRKKREVSPAEPVASLSTPVEGASAEATTDNRPAAVAGEPTYEEISILAYSFWEARGCQGGCPEDDWFAAVEQLRARG